MFYLWSFIPPNFFLYEVNLSTPSTGSEGSRKNGILKKPLESRHSKKKGRPWNSEWNVGIRTSKRFYSFFKPSSREEKEGKIRERGRGSSIEKGCKLLVRNLFLFYWHQHQPIHHLSDLAFRNVKCTHHHKVYQEMRGICGGNLHSDFDHVSILHEKGYMTPDEPQEWKFTTKMFGAGVSNNDHNTQFLYWYFLRVMERQITRMMMITKWMTQRGMGYRYEDWGKNRHLERGSVGSYSDITFIHIF